MLKLFLKKKMPMAICTYWYSIQGENGNVVEDSESYIDKKHLKYWEECIDSMYHPVDMTLMQSLLAPKIEDSIN